MSANTKLMQLLKEMAEVSAEIDNIAAIVEFISENKNGLHWLWKFLSRN